MTSTTRRRVGAVLLSGGLAAGTLGVGVAGLLTWQALVSESLAG